MITPAETDAGLRAYEQRLAFASLRRKKMPLVYALFSVVLLVGGAALALSGWLGFGALVIATAIAFVFFAVWNWKRLCALDVVNQELLAQLQAKHGENLPWLEVERQQAEIRRIQTEQAQA